MNPNHVKRAGGLAQLIATGFVLVMFFWVLDVLVNVYVFRQGGLRDQLFHLKPAELWSRGLASGLILAFTIYALGIANRLELTKARLETELAERQRAESALREAEGKYRSLVEQMPAAVYIWELGKHGACLYISPQVEKMLGFTVAEWLADPALFFQQVHPDDRDQAIRAEDHTRTTAEPLYSEFRMLDRGGRVVWVRDQSVVLRDEAGQSRYNQGILIDITESKVTEKALQVANEHLMTGISELEQRTREIALLNELGDLLQSCLGVEDAYAVIKQSAQRLFPEESGVLFLISASRNQVEAVATWGAAPATPDTAAFGPDDCWALRRGQPHVVEGSDSGLRCQHLATSGPAAYMCVPMVAQGETVGVFHLQGTTAPPDAGQLRLSVVQQQLARTVADSIALALANLKLRETLRQRSIRDPLTGLFNRHYLEETLEREIRRAARGERPVAIIMLDLDHFKRFNDDFGHDGGDTLLRELGTFLWTHVRQEDIACRYGGEEFTLVLPDASLDIARQRAEYLREEVKHLNVRHNGQPVGAVSLSLGVAVFPGHGLTGEVVLKAADVALYRAKREGRDRVVVAQ
jgi:diguanylate cyclase (GGDEF)-like protein/PAS domain S-box-containing protein